MFLRLDTVLSCAPVERAQGEPQESAMRGCGRLHCAASIRWPPCPMVRSGVFRSAVACGLPRYCKDFPVACLIARRRPAACCLQHGRSHSVLLLLSESESERQQPVMSALGNDDVPPFWLAVTVLLAGLGERVTLLMFWGLVL